ncbi:MAG TPA: phosphate signaling complex protein PhoU [Azospirillaceae bacterium]|nr:phosphate signaling complex protein PhoU [Azospirillaceae bacterium]
MADRHTDHIVHAYDRELRRLDTLIAEMGGHCEAQLTSAIRALEKRDAPLAEETIGKDIVIDALEHEIESLVVRLLALRAPVADDLRHVLAALKISSALERVGDYAKNIAKRSLELNKAPPVAAMPSVLKLARQVQAELNDCLDAVASFDPERAIEVWKSDAEIDDLHAASMKEIFACMTADSSLIGPCSSLLFVAKNLERVGDLATNMAEMVQFYATGQRIAEPRPKGG